MEYFIQAGRKLYRSPIEGRNRPTVLHVILGMFLVLVLAVHAGIMWQEGQDFDSINPTVIISRAGWTTLYDTGSLSGSCTGEMIASSTCLASPDNPALWESSTRRSDPDHRQKTAKLQGREIWLGQVIPTTDLRKAAAAGANEIILGMLLGDHEVWIDGEKYVQGSFRYTTVPVVVRLPMQRLHQPKPLSLAVRIQHNRGAMYPDLFTRLFQEGFATAQVSEMYVHSMMVMDG